jgi:hypothetical protein
MDLVRVQSIHVNTIFELGYRSRVHDLRNTPYLKNMIMAALVV